MIRAAALLLVAGLGFSIFAVGAALPPLFAPLLGANAEASTILDVALLIGLALGLSLAGGVVRDAPVAPSASRQPWRHYLFGALLAMLAMQVLGRLTSGVEILRGWRGGPSAGAGAVIDLGLAAALSLIPSALLGMALGLVMEAPDASSGRETRSPLLALPAALVGAGMSALVLGFLAPGGRGSHSGALLLATASAGLVFAGLFLVSLVARWSARRASAPGVAANAGAVPSAQGEWTRLVGLEASLAGFSLALVATVLRHVATLSFGDSERTVALLGAAFLCCLALGGLTSALGRWPSAVTIAVTAWLAVAFLGLLHLVLDDTPYGAHVLRAIFRDQPQTFPLYLGTAFAALVALLLVPIGLIGGLLSVLARSLAQPGAARRVYAFATLGAAVGLALGGYALLLWLDLDEVFRVALFAFALLAVLLTFRLRSRARVVAAGLFAAACLAAVLLPGWRPERLTSGVFSLRTPSPASFDGPRAFFDAWNEDRSVEFYQDDPFASTAVVRVAAGVAKGLAVATNGRMAGHAPLDDPTTTLLAVLPALLGENSDRLLLIGLGAGTTLGATVARGDVQYVVVAERSAAGVRAARAIDAERGKSFARPGVELVQADPLRLLVHGRETFDAIVAAPATPWVRGDGVLFSREFYAAAKARLSPGGVLVQGFRVLDADDASVARVLRTFATDFPRSAVWYGLGQDLLLVGFEDDAASLDLARVEGRLAAPAIQASLARIGIVGAPALFAHELVPEGVLAASRLEGELETLAAPRVAAGAALAQFSGTVGRLPPTYATAAARFGTERALLRRLAQAEGGQLSDAATASAVTELCRYRAEECAVAIAAWQTRTPDAPALALLTRQLAKDPARAAWVAPALQTSLQQLLGTRPLVGSISVESARSASDVFSRHYSHQEPLSHATLLGIWQRCDDGAKGQCLAGLERLRRELAQDGAHAKQPEGSTGAGD